MKQCYDVIFFPEQTGWNHNPPKKHVQVIDIVRLCGVLHASCIHITLVFSQENIGTLGVLVSHCSHSEDVFNQSLKQPKLGIPSNEPMVKEICSQISQQKHQKTNHHDL